MPQTVNADVLGRATLATRFKNRDIKKKLSDSTENNNVITSPSEAINTNPLIRVESFDPQKTDIKVAVNVAANRKYDVDRKLGNKLQFYKQGKLLDEEQSKEEQKFIKSPLTSLVGSTESDPQYSSVATILNGNLFFNDHFVLYDGATRRLLCRRSEPVETEREYTCFVVMKATQDKPKEVRAERLTFAFGEDHDAVYRAGVEQIAANDIAGDIEYAIYGQQLLVKGDRIPIQDLANDFDDLFHLFRFPQTQTDTYDEIKKITTSSYGAALGARELYQGLPDKDLMVNGQPLDRVLVRDALNGEITSVPLKEYDRSYVLKALKRWKYVDVAALGKDTVDNEGEYKFETVDGEELLKVRLKRNYMEHVLIGITKNNNVIAAVLAGNKIEQKGFTPETAREEVITQQHLKDDDVTDLFLICNGADTIMRQDGVDVIQTERGGRDEATSVIMFATKRDEPGDAPAHEEEGASRQDQHVSSGDTEALGYTSEIIDKAGKRTAAETLQLIRDVEGILTAEGKQGSLRPKIADIKEVAYFTEGRVAYIPDTKGDLYVIGDIHADLTYLRAILNDMDFIGKAVRGEPCHLAFVGDYVDAGNANSSVLETVLALKCAFPDKVTLLMGNHENRVHVHEETERWKGHRSVLATDMQNNSFEEELLEHFGSMDGDVVIKEFVGLFEKFPVLAVTKKGIAIMHASQPPQTVQDKYDLTNNGLPGIAHNKEILEQLYFTFVNRNEQQDDRGKIFKDADHQWVGRDSFDSFMNAIGARIMVRGHDGEAPWDHTNFGKRLITIISTDHRSVNYGYFSLTLEGRYGRFDLSVDYDTIDPEATIAGRKLKSLVDHSDQYIFNDLMKRLIESNEEAYKYLLEWRGPYHTENGCVLEYIAGTFGIDQGSDNDRHAQALEALRALYKARDREKLLSMLMEEFKYFTWTASGEHRF
ncbi:MAG: serine/threonine protein phosphatase, partial [Candidatus Omnitrophica bacterium]|nr:serine/threonine protein phosphatase [Candidatus Omnitrophota bacterium]